MSKPDAQQADRDYTLGWRARRDGVEHAESSPDGYIAGWNAAHDAIRSGRSIEWSRGTDGVEVKLANVEVKNEARA